MPRHTKYSSRWVRLAPIVFITYGLAYVDRANYSIGSAGGLASDLGITGQAGALLGALFFLGYFLVSDPWGVVRGNPQRQAPNVLELAGLGRAGRADRRH